MKHAGQKPTFSSKKNSRANSFELRKPLAMGILPKDMKGSMLPEQLRHCGTGALLSDWILNWKFALLKEAGLQIACRDARAYQPAIDARRAPSLCDACPVIAVVDDREKGISNAHRWL